MSSLQHFDSSYARINSGGGKVFSDNIGSLAINIHPRPQPQRQANPRCPPASSNFIGRALELEQMWTSFFGPGVKFDQRRVFLLIGMGGCGKTQLARKFMTRVYHKFQNTTNLVFYLDATTEQTLKASLVAIAKANGAGESSEEALSWMADLDKEMFLYFDNADNPAINLRDYFPNSDHARILITTRLRDAQRDYGSGRGSAIQLGPLNEDEAKELLLDTAAQEPHSSQDQAIAGLIQELHCLPLAIVQAGAAIFKAKWTFEEYLERFRRLHTSLMDGKQDRVESKAIDDYPWHVHTTWRLSYDRLSESTAKLLQLCAHLHHTGITEDLFRLAFNGLKTDRICNPPLPFVEQEPVAGAFLESFATEGVWDETMFRWCIQEACSFSLLSYNTDNHTYAIHPLIHDCLQSVATHPSQAAFVLAISIEPCWQDKVRLTSFAPHAQRILDRMDERQATWLHPTLARSLSRCLWHAGMHSSIDKTSKIALQNMSGQLSPDHDMFFVFQNDQAEALLHMGQYSSAEKLLKEFLPQSQAARGVNHKGTIAAMGNLASAYRLQGHLDKAAEMQRDILERTRETMGANHHTTIKILANLATTLRSLGRYYEAEGMEKEVLVKRRATLGAKHPHTIRAMANLASTLHSLGRHQEAEEMRRDVLEKRRAILGANHPDTIRALANLAATLHILCRYQEAAGMEREVLEKRRIILGPRHLDTYQSLTNIAISMSKQGQAAEAEPMLREAVEAFTRLLGPDHRITVWAQAGLEGCIAEIQRQVQAPIYADSPVNPDTGVQSDPADPTFTPMPGAWETSPPFESTQAISEASSWSAASYFGQLSIALENVTRTFRS